jgi:hypothetical protein
MTGLNEIPDEVKWKLSARCAATLPALYDSVFRGEVGDRYDILEHKVWMELAQMAHDMVRNLALPVRSAEELAHALSVVMAVLFGAEYKTETLELSGGRGVLVVKRCPFLEHGHATSENTFHKCMAFTLTAVPVLNRDFSARYVRAMCMGEKQCEIKIEPVKDTAKKGD